jgi:hypothetical protein
MKGGEVAMMLTGSFLGGTINALCFLVDIDSGCVLSPLGGGGGNSGGGFLAHPQQGGSYPAPA